MMVKRIVLLTSSHDKSLFEDKVNDLDGFDTVDDEIDEIRRRLVVRRVDVRQERGGKWVD